MNQVPVSHTIVKLRVCGTWGAGLGECLSRVSSSWQGIPTADGSLIAEGSGKGWNG